MGPRPHRRGSEQLGGQGPLKIQRLLLLVGITALGVLLFVILRPDPAPGNGEASAPTINTGSNSTAPESVSTTQQTTTSTTTIPVTPSSQASTTSQLAAPVFASAIVEVSAEELHASWRPGCPLPVESLRAVDVSHWGYQGETHIGRLIVAADVAEEVVAIMSDLFEAGFPIERMEPVDAYDGDDNASMSANNTSGFNCRPVTGGSSWSDHSYGTAIDVNPLVNPYVRRDTVLPPEGAPYVDREQDAPGMIHEGDFVVETFAHRGWVWGGAWSFPKDYQHFTRAGG